MAWSFVGLGTNVEVAATAHTLVEPAGVASGDLLVACIASRIGSATQITLPSGWTRVAQQLNNNTASNTTAAASGMMAYIVRGASAPALTFTHPVAPSVAIGRIVAYRGVNAAAPFDIGNSSTSSSAINGNTGNVLTTAANDLCVVMMAGGQEGSWSAFTGAGNTSSGTGSGATAAPSTTAWQERSDVQTTTGVDTSLAIADTVAATATNVTGAASTTIQALNVGIVGAFKSAPSNPVGTLNVTLGALTLVGISTPYTHWDEVNKAPTIDLNYQQLYAYLPDSTPGLYYNVRTKHGFSSGKRYFELYPAWEAQKVGICDESFPVTTPGTTNWLGSTAGGVGMSAALDVAGDITINGVVTTWAHGIDLSVNTVCVAVDYDAKLIWFRIDEGIWNGNASANPETGVGGLSIAAMSGTLYAATSLSADGSETDGYFGLTAPNVNWWAIPAGYVPIRNTLPISTVGTLTATLGALTLAATGTVTTDPVRTGYLGTPWTPAALGSDLLTWLDASDASTVTVTGSGVSQWRDKSGNARHANQSTDASRPAYSGNKVALNDGDTLLLTAGLPATYDCIAVGRPRDNAYGGASGYRVLLQVDSNNYPVIIDNAGNVGTYGGGFSSSGYSWASNTDGFNYATINGTTSVATHGMNGGAQQNTGSGVAPSPPISLTRSDYAMPWGDLYEIIFVPYGSSLDTKQKLEGYVAHKWGLTALLPGGHPYKTSPPMDGYLLGALTLAAAGGPLVVTTVGTLNATLGALTLTSTGTVANQVFTGTLAVTLGALTLAGTAKALASGALSTTLGALTLAGTAKALAGGTLSTTLGALTLAGSGTVANQIFTGTLNTTLGALTLAGTAKALASGTLNVTLGALTLNGTGAVTAKGTLNTTLGALILSATGTVFDIVPGAVTGTLNVTLGALTLSAAGVVVPVATNHLKVWTGSAWAIKPAKVWSGSAWVTRPAKYWDGSAWVG